MTNPHYFIAISLPHSLKTTLSEWQRNLRTYLPYKQWPNKDDLHITLKFLGEVDDKRIDNFHKKLEKLTFIKSFHTMVQSIGTFGHKERPRVLWAGVELNDSLVLLQKKVEEYALVSGLQEDTRTYRPHITLAKRWNGIAKVGILEKLKQDFQDESFSLKINEVILYQIHPKRNPKYEALYTYSLKE